MGCGDETVFRMGWMLVGGKSASGVFVPATGWTDAGNATLGKSMGEMRGKVNTVTVTLCFQYANDPRSPLGQVTVGASLSSDGMLDPTTATDISALRAYRYVRGGWWVVGDGTNIGVAMVSGTLAAFTA